ncbi:hypothetical protein N0V88_006814 [Collariella sp. IMI 366227]|nr:hypothetical protein N0V88_006814 [Collariella sp. IMI 366227]
MSGHQKRMIKPNFERFWLLKMIIILYHSLRQRAEYTLPGQSAAAEGRDIFRMDSHNAEAGDRVYDKAGIKGVIQKGWRQYDPATKRNITVRLGEQFLNAHLPGGHILNDTDLPGLQVLGTKIRFDWKADMDELLREEMHVLLEDRHGSNLFELEELQQMWVVSGRQAGGLQMVQAVVVAIARHMRKVGNEMFDSLCKGRVVDNQPVPEEEDGKDERFKIEPGQPPVEVQVMLWKVTVQPARRVAALKHPVAKSQGTRRPVELRFGVWSALLHKQKPWFDRDRWATAAKYSRERHAESLPDVFDVVCV